MGWSFTNVILMTVVAGCVILSGNADPKDGRAVVWQDEFDGTELDASKWRFRRTMSSGDNEYVNDRRTVRLENGLLHLQVTRSKEPGKKCVLPEGLATHDTMGFRYGYLEMRAKLPFKHGAWPSFWLQSTPSLQKCPLMSEVDIVEVFSSTNRVVSNLHKWTKQDPVTKRVGHTMLPGGEGSAKRAYDFAAATNRLSDEFHVYGLEWTPRAMSFYVDGKRYASYPIDEANDFSAKTLPGMSCFQDFQSIILNNEVFTPGHGWCPKTCALQDDAALPFDYCVDWIRLYQGPEEEFKPL